MTRPDFRQLKSDIARLEELDRVLGTIMSDDDRQTAAVREACSAVLLKSAQHSLENVPVEELSHSKAGIRVAILKEAGYNDLKQLDEAADWEISGIDGVGEKQVEAIRSIIAEFKARLTDYTSVRLSAEDRSTENLTMILNLARLKNSRTVRADYAGLADSVHSFTENVLPRIRIRNGFRWAFSGRDAKESTVQGYDEIRAFFDSPSYERGLRMINAYDEAINSDMPSAMKDFEQNGADYYALIESLGGTKIEKPLIYSSIPEQLAAEIDAFPLNQSLFKGNLRAYQVFGTKYILHQKRVLLGDEMGLGKTVQAVAAMAHLEAAEPDALKHYLVICPASVLVNWCREIQKFSSLNVHLIHGPYLEDAFSRWQSEGGAGVTNYESMGKIVRRIDNHMHLKLLVIDEAHYIKNPGAQRTKFIRRLDDESERILMMTGTPLENSVAEMCSLIDFVRPDMGDKVRMMAYISRAPEFREMLAPLYLRRVRTDVLEELPPLTRADEWCEMTESDRSDYIEKLNERNFSAMRRVSFLWKTDTAEGAATSAKACRLLELCREAKDEGRKVIVYSYFRETVEKVTALLGRACIGTITGSTPITDRQAVIDRLKEAEKGSVLVAQIQAGGTGLNIQSASVVIFCEPQIKPSLTNQALSRVYRMGQVRHVLVYHLLCPGTVDEAVMSILEAKQQEFDTYADESSMAEATESLFDREWIRTFLDEEHRRYLPMVVTEGQL